MRVSQLGPVLFCLLISASLSAQQSNPTTRTSDPQAVALAQRSLTALTGGAPVSDVTLTGTVQRIAGSDNETGTASVKGTALGDSRLDLSLPAGNRSEIRNHAALPLLGSLPPLAPTAATQAVQRAGAWIGPDGVIHGMATHNVMTDATWFFPPSTLARILSSGGYILSYVGPETLNGQSVTHLQVSQPLPATMTVPQQVATLMLHLSQMDLYLDSTTLLPVALDFNVHPDNNAGLDIPAEIQFSNYQPVNGVQVPFHVQRYLNNGLVLDLQINNVTFNSGLPGTTFQLQ